MSDIEDLYVSEEPKSIEIKGVEIKFKELSGIEYSNIIDDLDVDPTDPDSLREMDYIKEVINRCVIEPENIDVSRLKFDVLIELAKEIQGGELVGGAGNLRKK